MQQPLPLPLLSETGFLTILQQESRSSLSSQCYLLFLPFNVNRLLALNGGSRQIQRKRENLERQFGEHYVDISNCVDTPRFRGKEEVRDVFRQTNTHETLQVACEINGHPIRAVIDTGAQISIMSTKFAKKCDLYSSIDRRFAGRAIGVGSSEILGRSTSQMRLGAMRFKIDFSVLENTRIDLIIGLDILRKYQCDVCLRENVVKLHYHNKVFRVPIISQSSPMIYETSQQYHELVRDDRIEKSSVFDETETEPFCCQHEEDVEEEDENYEVVSMEGW